MFWKTRATNTRLYVLENAFSQANGKMSTLFLKEQSGHFTLGLRKCGKSVVSVFAQMLDRANFYKTKL